MSPFGEAKLPLQKLKNSVDLLDKEISEILAHNKARIEKQRS
jgi:hypothetical protein